MLNTDALARHRVCGRLVEVTDGDQGNIIVPHVCPECGQGGDYDRVGPITETFLVELAARKGVHATGAAAQLAHELMLDLASIAPGGADGYVTRADVEKYLQSPPVAKPEPEPVEVPVTHVGTIDPNVLIKMINEVVDLKINEHLIRDHADPLAALVNDQGGGDVQS